MRTCKLTKDGLIVTRNGELIVRDAVTILRRLDGFMSEFEIIPGKRIPLFVGLIEEFGGLSEQQAASLRAQLEAAAPDQPSPDEFRLAFEELVADGTLVPTGRFRAARDGSMQEVYVHRDFAGDLPK